MRVTQRRLVALWVLAVVLACTSQNGLPVKQLAADQTLRLPIGSEPRVGATSLDPARLSFPVETSIGDNLFDGLYRFDEQMREQPDIADGMPLVSADGMTYTFHLRHDVRFWNGERVTATDLMYSWNREAATQGDWAAAFQPVVGYDVVANANGDPTRSQLAGVSAPDPYTLVVRLSAPSGYWLAELALPGAWVVNAKAIEQGGPDQWWTNPATLVGTGPFRLTKWTHSAELDFAAVENWWGGSTGALKRLELHVVADRTARWKGYADGQYDMLGFGRADLGVNAIPELAALRSDPAHHAEIHTWPFGTTGWVAFNLQSGPFSGYDQGRLLRQAFSQAIDRQKLARAVCQGGTICVPASGGLIAKGLQGYLGDGSDPTAKFDPSSARAIVKRIDPDGSLLRDLVFYFPIEAFDPTQAVAQNLAAQWLENLGVNVTIRALDRDTFFTEMSYGRLTFFREGWQADYDHPQDWFDNLFINSAGCAQFFCDTSGTIYDRDGFTALIASADQKPLSAALPDYLKAGKMLVDDFAVATLYYLVRTVVIKPYVEGYGANALWEDRWTSLRVLQH